MANLSVDGLISGLSTSDLIDQLMLLEKQPQVRLQQKRDAVTVLTQTYQTLNTRFAGIQSAAAALAKAEGWQVLKASSTDATRATATASSSASPMSFTFSVDSLAATHSMLSEASADLVDVVATQPLVISVNGEVKPAIDVGDGKLSTIIANINAAKYGISAAAVKVGEGQYKLQLTATTSGEAASFTIDPTGLDALLGADGDADAFDVIVEGQDAAILVGGSAAHRITSASNTFADVLPGVSITALKTGPELVTVNVAQDDGAVATKVKALVDAVNGALGSIEANSTYDPKLRKGGPLLGDSLARNLESQLLRIAGELPAGRSLADVGMGIDSNGKLTFDEAKFKAAYANDPEAVADLFTGASTADDTDGLAVRLEALAKAATDSQTGLISLAIKGKESLTKTYEQQIEAWDVRLEKKEAALKRQYTALETALSSLRNQSTWLAGQLTGLLANNG